MALTVEMQNTGDPGLQREVVATIEHVLADRPGNWRVSIVGSQANDKWEMKITGPNAFERSYTLEGSIGEKLAYRPQAEDLAWPFPRLVPFVTLLAHNRFHSGRNLARPEWVENSDVQLREIRLISRGNDQLVNAGSSSNHRVLKQSIR